MALRVDNKILYNTFPSEFQNNMVIVVTYKNDSS